MASRRYLFPSRGSLLGLGRYWDIDEFSEGPHILDMAVRRWDDAEGWTHLREGITRAAYDAERTNDKHLVHGRALYAPVDGEVISCWRNAPDNPTPGKKLPGVNGSKSKEKKTIFISGNHLAILTDDGHVLLIAHMTPGTIPRALCPNEGDHAEDATNKDGDYPVEAFLPVGSRPRVRRGQFIGRAGTPGTPLAPTSTSM